MANQISFSRETNWGFLKNFDQLVRQLIFARYIYSLLKTNCPWIIGTRFQSFSGFANVCQHIEACSQSSNDPDSFFFTNAALSKIDQHLIQMHPCSQGRPRIQSALPNYVPVFSDCLPNTTNQMFGSRLCTELGKELIRMDKLLLLTGSHGKTKQGPEMQPC